MYIETSFQQYGENAKLEFSVSSSDIGKLSCLKFYYHMYGATINTLNVYNGNAEIFTKSGNQGNVWLFANVTMALRSEVSSIHILYYNKVSIYRALWLAETACFIREQRTGWWRVGFQIFASEFWQIWPKLNIPCDSDKRNGNELFACSKYGSQRPLLTTAVFKLYYNIIFC